MICIGDVDYKCSLYHPKIGDILIIVGVISCMKLWLLINPDIYVGDYTTNLKPGFSPLYGVFGLKSVALVHV